MKIYGKNINIITYKVLVSQNILKTFSELKKDNKKDIFLSPLTKLEDIFNFKKDLSIENLISEIDFNYKNKILNEKYIIDLSDSINREVEEEIIIPAFEYNKIIKTLLCISEEKVNQRNIYKILEYINKYFSDINVVIVGFDIDVNKINKLNISILYIVSKLQGTISINNIESLCIEMKNDFFEVEDKDSLLRFLEVKTGMVITTKIINDFLNGQSNFNSYLIDKAFKTIF